MPCSHLRFLVVEDHEFQRQMLSQLLRRLGAAAVHTAEDGRAALQVLRDPDRPVDIVVTDVSMPGMDGMEFVRHLSEGGFDVGVILTSALDEDLIASVAHMAQAYQVKLLGVMRKPPTAAKIVALVQLHQPASPPGSGPEVPFSFDEIAHAWASGEFEPWFEPRVELSTRKLRGLSAVLRWRHPERGVLDAAAFRRSVEARGLGDDLVWLTLQKAVAEGRTWVQQGFDLPVCVTLSFNSLTDTDIAVRIRQIASREGLEPRHLVLSIPEALLARTTQPRALENLARLRVDGFGLGIDGFGSGSLALDELSRVALTEIRINADYVKGVHRSDSDRAGLAVGLQVAHELGLEAVADGIASKGEWTVLREWGCDVGQGPYISPPLAAAEVPGWLRAWTPRSPGP